MLAAVVLVRKSRVELHTSLLAQPVLSISRLLSLDVEGGMGQRNILILASPSLPPIFIFRSGKLTSGVISGTNLTFLTYWFTWEIGKPGLLLASLRGPDF